MKLKRRRRVNHQKAKSLLEESREDVFLTVKPAKQRAVAQELSPALEKVMHIAQDHMET